MSYRQSKLWLSSLAAKNDDWESKRTVLREEYESVRKNVVYLLEKIHQDFPSLTLHDITHVDALWQVGSVIVGETYSINPLEGFVLGCAFIMHDAVLSYDAFGGVEQLRETDLWKDCYADYQADTMLNEEEKLYETDFRTIRLLHAKSAENLYEKLFTREDGSKFYLIEDETLRSHLGPLICQIAASHHWDVDELKRIDTQYSALAMFPKEWSVNPLRLACILRCADAGHIDAMRAPDSLFKVLRLNGVSQNHWNAQNRLTQLTVDKHDKKYVYFNSTKPFREEDFAAWNVVYDAVCLLNNEIKKCNQLLANNDEEEFPIKGVRGATSREELNEYIRTQGWKPCDANIHISDIESIVRNLGGENLYGKSHRLEIILRELIQNARDAIVARQQIEGNEEFWGKINVRIEKVADDKISVCIEDNGVGMSMNTIKDYFLNFGSSFWRSDLAKMEYPGLNASGFNAVGKFGIGFFAVFMLAEEVIVETRKYDAGLKETIRLRFPNGLCLRPIVSPIKGKSTSVSTRIQFVVNNKKANWKPMIQLASNGRSIEVFSVPFACVLSRLTAGLDVDVFYSELGAKLTKVHTDINESDFDICQWLKDITYATYHGQKYVDYIEKNHHRVRRVECNGKCYGLAALNTFYTAKDTLFGIESVGGLSTFRDYRLIGDDWLGYLSDEPKSATRNTSISDVYKENWAKEQYKILCNVGLSDVDKLYLPYIVAKYNVDMSDVMWIRVLEKNKKEFRTDTLQNIITDMHNTHIKLVLPIEESYYDIVATELNLEQSQIKLGNDEMLFIAHIESDFLLSAASYVSSPRTIRGCINLIAEQMSLSLEASREADKAISRSGDSLEGIVLSII